VANQIYPHHFAPGSPVTRVLDTLLAEAAPAPLGELAQHASLSRDRHALNERYLTELKKRTRTPVAELPMVFAQQLGPTHVAQLGEELHAKLSLVR